LALAEGLCQWQKVLTVIAFIIGKKLLSQGPWLLLMLARGMVFAVVGRSLVLAEGPCQQQKVLSVVFAIIRQIIPESTHHLHTFLKNIS